MNHQTASTPCDRQNPCKNWKLKRNGLSTDKPVSIYHSNRHQIVEKEVPPHVFCTSHQSGTALHEINTTTEAPESPRTEHDDENSGRSRKQEQARRGARARDRMGNGEGGVGVQGNNGAGEGRAGCIEMASVAK
ncbi:hypothetical protein M758_9G012800 [Ceratodon purpureus]|nr:hypothetical protein M758_9G012800 [Ceratodon purpureus]